MSAKVLSEYHCYRAAGYSAAHALSAARAVVQFRELEQCGLVRLRAEDEQESYFAVYGEPEGYTDGYGKRVSAAQEREEICRQIERDGCLCVVAEWRASESEAWRTADSVGMCVGYRNALSPRENCYVPDLMRSAVQAVAAQSGGEI